MLVGKEVRTKKGKADCPFVGKQVKTSVGSFQTPNQHTAVTTSQRRDGGMAKRSADKTDLRLYVPTQGRYNQRRNQRKYIPTCVGRLR